MQIGHRVSTDLDWFSTTQQLNTPARQQLVKHLQASNALTLVSEEDGMLFTQLLEVEVSFIYQHHHLLETTIEYDGIQIASPPDIGLMKLAAVNSRGTRRDFVDLYCLQDVITLEQLFDLATEKYKDRPNFLAVTARALAYFADAEQQPMPNMLRPVSWNDVRNYCENAARKLARQLSGISP